VVSIVPVHTLRVHSSLSISLPSHHSQILVRFSSSAKILIPSSNVIELSPRTHPLHLDSCFEQGNTTSSDQRSLAIDASLDPPFPRSAKPVRGTAKPPLRKHPRLHHHSRQSTRRRTTCCLQRSITRSSINPSSQQPQPGLCSSSESVSDASRTTRHLQNDSSQLDQLDTPNMSHVNGIKISREYTLA
jgi:hypothetical protein